VVILDTQYPEHRTQYPIDCIYKSFLDISSMGLATVYMCICMLYTVSLFYVLYPIYHVLCAYIPYTMYVYTLFYMVKRQNLVTFCNILYIWVIRLLF
jgi:hypothetical protein